MAKVKKEKTDKKIKSSGKGERFADMSATATVIEEPDLTATSNLSNSSNESNSPKVAKAARVRGKKYLSSKKQVELGKAYPIKEALELLKKVSYAKFGGSVEVHLNVIEKGIFGEVSLPHFQGKARKIAIFDEELGEKIKAGKVDFEVLLATPADMPKILALAKILGPKGLMPNPKNGTLVPDPKKAAEKFSGGGMHYKTDKDFPIIHLTIGKLVQPEEELVANFETLVKAVNPKKIIKAIIKSTMSPAIKISF